METYLRLVIAALLLLAAICVLLPIARSMVQARSRSARATREDTADPAMRASFGADGLPHIIRATYAPLRQPRFRERPTLWWVHALTDAYAELHAPAPVGAPTVDGGDNGGALRVADGDSGAGHAGMLAASRGPRWYVLVAANLGCFAAGFALHSAITIQSPVVHTYSALPVRPLPHRAVSTQRDHHGAPTHLSFAIIASHLRIDRHTFGMSLPSGSVFVDLHVALTNTTSGSEPYAFESFSLRALPSGAIYAPRLNPDLLNTQLLDDTLSGGQSVEGDISFVVSQSDTTFRLSYRGAGQMHPVAVPIR